MACGEEGLLSKKEPRHIYRPCSISASRRFDGFREPTSVLCSRFVRFGRGAALGLPITMYLKSRISVRETVAT